MNSENTPTTVDARVRKRRGVAAVGGATGAVGTVEAFEAPSGVLRGHAGAAVGDLDGRVVAVAVDADGGVRAAPMRRITRRNGTLADQSVAQASDGPRPELTVTYRRRSTRPRQRAP